MTSPLAAQVRAELRRASFRQYRDLEAALGSLPETALQDLLRLFRDLEADANLKARRAATQPWRGGR